MEAPVFFLPMDNTLRFGTVAATTGSYDCCRLRNSRNANGEQDAPSQRLEILPAAYMQGKKPPVFAFVQREGGGGSWVGSRGPRLASDRRP